MLSVPDQIELLVNVSYELEKIKFPASADRTNGWVRASYIIGYALEFGYGKNKIQKQLQNAIDDITQEMSDLCAKVEL